MSADRDHVSLCASPDSLSVTPEDSRPGTPQPEEKHADTRVVERVIYLPPLPSCTAQPPGLVQFHDTITCVKCYCIRPHPLFCENGHAHCQQCVDDICIDKTCSVCFGELKRSPIWDSVNAIIETNCCSPRMAKCRYCNYYMYRHDIIDFHKFECTGRFHRSGPICIDLRQVRNKSLDSFAVYHRDIRLMYTCDPISFQSRQKDKKLWVASPKHEWVLVIDPTGRVSTLAAKRNFVVRICVIHKAKSDSGRHCNSVCEFYFAMPCDPGEAGTLMYGVDVNYAYTMLCKPGVVIAAKTVAPPNIKELPSLSHPCVLRMATPPRAPEYREFYTHVGVPVIKANVMPAKNMEDGEHVITTYWKHPGFGASNTTGFRFVTVYNKHRGLTFYCYMCGASSNSLEHFLSDICSGLITRDCLMECEALSERLNRAVNAGQTWSDPGNFNMTFKSMYSHIIATKTRPTTHQESHSTRKEEFMRRFHVVKEELHQKDDLGFTCREDRKEYDYQNAWNVSHLKRLQKFTESKTHKELTTIVQEKRDRFDKSLASYDRAVAPPAREPTPAQARPPMMRSHLPGVRRMPQSIGSMAPQRPLTNHNTMHAAGHGNEEPRWNRGRGRGRGRGAQRHTEPRMEKRASDDSVHHQYKRQRNGYTNPPANHHPPVNHHPRPEHHPPTNQYPRPEHRPPLNPPGHYPQFPHPPIYDGRRPVAEQPQKTPLLPLPPQIQTAHRQYMSSPQGRR